MIFEVIGHHLFVAATMEVKDGGNGSNRIKVCEVHP
jgi:hypothetical protein